MSLYESLLALGVLVPLISFVILVFWGARIGKPKSSYVAIAAIAVSCLFSTIVLLGWRGMDQAQRAAAAADAYRYHWADFGPIAIDVGVKLDSLTVIMYFMVTFVSLCIFVFSNGYMAGHSDEVDGQCKYHRFFAYFSLFAFSMLGLVVSSSLLFLFIFWELVGLCSYLLIGFYFDKKFASDAAIKAFVTNRVGDFGFVIGLAMVVLYLGTFDLDQAAANFAADFRASAAAGFEPERSAGIFAASINLFGWQVSGMALATLMGIGLFCGAMGKSAQFPLHVWLPDAMAGPTPVSALIHAATMVAAGVYLVARVFRLLTPDAQMFIAIIGCVTLTLTALIAIVQTDIKKVLAYSTLSQLGYMIFGMGVGAWIAALFHLMTHAFFKAMLFLGSGQVIEGCHHEQDIRKMGGLRKKMPYTCWTFFVGVLAIAGFGIPFAHFGLGGYFSKDEILAVAYERAYNIPRMQESDAAADDAGEHAKNVELRMENVERSTDATPIRLASADDPHSTFYILHSALASSNDGEHSEHHATANPAKLAIAATLPALPRIMFWLPILIAYVTPFYMMRCWVLTFWGKPRDHHVYDHAHETKMMYVPLVVLAVGTAVSSFALFRPIIDDAAAVATDSPALVAIDGTARDLAEAGGGAMLTLTHGAGVLDFRDPHAALGWLVGFAWVVGMGVAFVIYRDGLTIAERLRRIAPFALAHRVLQQKVYFDHVYDFALVGGTKLVGLLSYRIDQKIVDGLVNLAGAITRALGSLAGRQLDMPIKRTDIGLVDLLANGIANAFYDIGSQIRRPQTGRIRSYVLITAGTAAVVLMLVLFSEQLGDGLSVLRGGLVRMRDAVFAMAG